jgi:hypothetical protein
MAQWSYAEAPFTWNVKRTERKRQEEQAYSGFRRQRLRDGDKSEIFATSQNTAWKKEGNWA